MGGGLLQLVAYGAQDVYLTGNPQITFFKVVYRRHTNFAIESIQQTYNGQTEFGNTINCTVSRNGDLINRVYVEIDVKGLGYDTEINEHPRYVDYLGLKLLKNVVIEIGGQQIDKHYSDWMFIWNELSLPIGKRYGYDKMVGANGDELSKVENAKSTKLYIPLEFWFCRNIGLALPLIALQYHEVKFKIEFSEREEIALMYDTNNIILDQVLTDAAKVKIGSQLLCNIYVDYIFLDTDERRKFTQLSHEYLIEQLQFTGEEQYNQQIRLNFNHPVKELVWVSKWAAQNNTKYNNSLVNWNNYSINDKSNEHGKNSFVQGSIKLNGNDRIANREGRYFDLVQPYQHHTNIPKNGGINVYSFALKPEEHQPSGTLNMSRIDSAHLHVKINDTEKKKGSVLIYAINYNVLRILSGMGGLAYSN
tara:strand:- start:30 stop:1289 length:1260 start_codon:yes stop_codon:yes gene_type:complete